MLDSAKCRAFIAALWLVLASAPATTFAQSWTTLAPPPLARIDAVVTELSNGKFLITGGQPLQSSAVTATAQLYDPETNTWESVADMITARSLHAASLLPSGRVLVSGGWTGSGNYINQTEIFDPATRRWSAGPPLLASRYSHSQTALVDGRVLVTGGLAFTRPDLDTAEIFDEQSNSWRSAGYTATSGASVALRMKSGDVLVTGGANGFPEAVVFSAATSTWRNVRMNRVRVAHGMANLPDGRVLVSGGENKFFDGSVAYSYEVFDPATESWAPEASLTDGQVGHKLVTLADGRVLGIGGRGLGETTLSLLVAPVAAARIFDPATARWTPISPLRTATGTLNVVSTRNGRVFVFGPTTLEALSLGIDANAGTVDPVWGYAGRGYFNTPAITSDTKGVRASAFDARRGKTLLAVNCPGATCVARLDDHGGVDTSFGDAGIANFPRGSPANDVTDMKVLPDGKILLTYACSTACVMRLNANGSVDDAFANQGTLRVDPARTWMWVRMAVDAEGRIYIAGNCQAGDAVTLCVTRLTHAGAVDPAFAGGIPVRVGPAALTGIQVRDLSVSEETGVTIAGNCGYSSGSPGATVFEMFFCHARIGVDGSLGATSTSDALQRVVFPVGYQAPVPNSHVDATVLASGAIVAGVACSSDGTSPSHLCIFRIGSDRRVDQQYGQLGATVLSKPADCTQWIFASGWGRFVVDATGRGTLIFTCVREGNDLMRSTRISAEGTVLVTEAWQTAEGFSPEAGFTAFDGAVVLLGRIENSSGLGGAPQSIVSYRLLGASSRSKRQMVEYLFTPLNYYFITGRQNEQVLLDSIPGWTRTGESFAQFETDGVDRLPVSRFYFDRIARTKSRGTHFYTSSHADKTLLDAMNADNRVLPGLPVNESFDGYILPAAISGDCQAGTQPVYRLFRGNARFPDDPNHRFTAKRAIYDQFVAAGWDGEGVAFCVPL